MMVCTCVWYPDSVIDTLNFRDHDVMQKLFEIEYALSVYLSESLSI